MKRIWITLLCLSLLGVGTLAAQSCGTPLNPCEPGDIYVTYWIQTLTALPPIIPTATPAPTGTVAGQHYPILGLTPISSPTLISTATPFGLMATADLPTGPIYNGLATVEGNLQNAPDQIAPAGYLPDQTGYQLFSYIKWTFGSSVGDELAGPFGPMLGRLATIIGIEIVLAGIYFIFFVVRIVLRFVQWIITLILKFIPFMG